MRHSLKCLAVALLIAAESSAGDAVRPGKLELYPTWTSVGIEFSYTEDDNKNCEASFLWKKAGEANWRNGVDVTFDRARRLAWASVWPLDPGDRVEIEWTLQDADGGNSKETAQTLVKTILLQSNEGKTYWVSASGDDHEAGTKEKPWKTLAFAGRRVKPGDTVLVREGVYAEGDLFPGLKGAPGKPIVFEAAPGEKPVLDSSFVLDRDAKAWKEIKPGLFATSAPMYHTPGGGYVAQNGRRSFAYESLADLQSDKFKVARGWFFDAKSKQLYVRTNAEETPAKSTFHISRHAYGFHLSGCQHLVLRGFEIRNYGASLIRISEGSHDCVVYENDLHNGPSCVFMKGETTRDIALWKNEMREPGMEEFSWQQCYAVGYPNQAIYSQKAGRGLSICYNRIHDHFDLVSVESWKNPDKLAYHRDCDICFNELWNAGDDAIEVDGGGVNMRIHGNSIRNCLTAVSLAPVERGPVYVTRNHATFYNLFIKFNVAGVSSLGWTYIYHNTAYCLQRGPEGGTGLSFAAKIPCANKVLKNNILLVNEWAVRGGKAGNVLDANCYHPVPGKPPRRFQWEGKTLNTLDDFRKASGQEKRGLYQDPQLKTIPDAGRFDAPSDLSVVPPGRWERTVDWKLLALDLRPASPCIDRGVILRGINDVFSGKAPDIGAFERD